VSVELAAVNFMAEEIKDYLIDNSLLYLNDCFIFLPINGFPQEQNILEFYLSPTPVLSNLLDPAGRTRYNHEAAGRTSKLKSND